MAVLRSIGLMSGTSLDGVDVALVETDGETIAHLGPTGYRPYDDEERRLLRAALAEAAALDDRSARPGILAEAERFITEAHVEAVAALLTEHHIVPESIDVIGFHGQTVLHKPDAQLTVQIGDGPAMAKKLGIPVVYDFRAADVAAGGQGAPLVPTFHSALADKLVRPWPIAVLNIGGVANLTYTDGGEPAASDTGPGNALIDDFMRARTGRPFDRDGEQAAKGKIDEAFIARVLADPFFAAHCPKSLDRNAFAYAIDALSSHSVADGVATLTALTAAAVARIIPLLPFPPEAWIVTGGGAHNSTLLRMLQERLVPASVETANAVGWSADALEAQAFAFLAVRSLKGFWITCSSTTGVTWPMTGGVLAKP